MGCVQNATFQMCPKHFDAFQREKTSLVNCLKKSNNRLREDKQRKLKEIYIYTHKDWHLSNEIYQMLIITKDVIHFKSAY